MATEQEFRDAAARVRNWGRWGAEDQLGTLNLITPEAVVASARSVSRGKLFALGTELSERGVFDGDGYRRNPIHLMSVDGGDSARLLDHLGTWLPSHSLAAGAWGQGLMRFNDDYVIMPLQAASQWDALSHVYYDDQMYNGVHASAVTSAGAVRNSIDCVDAKGIAGGAVLIDLPGVEGVRHLAAGYAIQPEDLERALEAQGVDVWSGDIVLVRTGWWSQFDALSRKEWRANCPGLSWRCAEWLHRKEVAAVAADNLAVEVVEAGQEVVLPLHLLCLVEMGMLLGELWDFDALAADCADDGIYRCHLVAPPLKVVGAVGSPVNPIAIK